jgi:hypothetical protein
VRWLVLVLLLLLVQASGSTVTSPDAAMAGVAEQWVLLRQRPRAGQHHALAVKWLKSSPSHIPDAHLLCDRIKAALVRKWMASQCE